MRVLFFSLLNMVKTFDLSLTAAMVMFEQPFPDLKMRVSGLTGAAGLTVPGAVSAVPPGVF